MAEERRRQMSSFYAEATEYRRLHQGREGFEKRWGFSEKVKRTDRKEERKIFYY
jgi:hypothetical protein